MILIFSILALSGLMYFGRGIAQGIMEEPLGTKDEPACHFHHTTPPEVQSLKDYFEESDTQKRTPRG